MHKLARYTLCFVSCAWLMESAQGENWTRFRGPNGQGVSSETNLPVTWSSTENVAWKTRIPGTGWSSPIVFENNVFLTAVEEDGVACHVICVDRRDGSIVWNKEVHRQRTSSMRSQNSYATPTPVTDGQRVYAVFFDGTAVAVDFSGSVIWKNSEFKYYSLHGLGASPILAGAQLIMPFDGSSPDEEKLGWKIPWEQAVVMAWDSATGQVRWRGARGESRVGHVTPILVDEGRQIVSAGGDRVQGFDSVSGERIWSIYSQGEGVTPSPVAGNGMVFTSSGFEEPTIRAIRLGGSGDITQTHIAWEQKTGVPVLASPLLVAPYLYTITRDNILVCIEAETGKPVWQERLTGVHSASPVLVDGRIYILSELGETIVLQPGDHYEEIARNSLEETCKASMAVSQGNFFIRTSEHLFCIGNTVAP